MFFSSNKSKSLYLKLGFSFFILIFITTILQTSYTYFSTKKELYSEIENNINVSLKQLENSIITFVESYQVNNYNRIIKNEMAHQNLLAIILEDYVTGKIIGEDKYISGFFRNNEFEVIEYNIKNIEHKHQMNTSIFSKELELKNSQNETIAILKIYGTDYYINKKLFTIIKESLLNTLVMYSLIFLLIYFLIKKELINPIKNITTSLTFTQDSSIIAKEINQNSSIEFSTLTNSINKLISDIKKAHKDLEDSKFRWEFAVDGSGYGLWDWNTQTNEVFFSKRWKEMLGFKDEEIKGSLEEWKKKVHPDDLEQVFKDITDYLNGVKNFYRNEHRVKCKNGKYIWILDRGMIVERDLEGQPIRIIGTHKDISERRKHEKEMRQALTVFQNTNDGIIITDANNKIININNSFSKITGYQLSEIKGKTPSILKSYKHSDNFYSKMWEELLQKDTWSGEIINKHKNKDIAEEYLTINVIRNKENSIENFIGIFSDITLIKQQERLLQQQTKMLAIGEMIGNIAHQWRQPLSVISTISTGLKLRLELSENIPNNEIINNLESLNNQSQYLSKTIDDIRGFFRENINEEISKFNISQTIIKTNELMIDSLKFNLITTILETQEDIFIEGNQNLLMQILINLFNNSIDAFIENKIETKK